MRIAVIAPPWQRLPTQEYTGIEPVISDLAGELVRSGHEVTLFAPEGSVSEAEVVHYPENTSKLDFRSADPRVRRYIKDILAKYACARAEANGAEIIHNFTLAGEREHSIPVLHTVYGPPSDITSSAITELLENSNNFFTAVSDRQKVLFSESVPGARFIATVHKSVDPAKIQWSEKSDTYLLFMGHSGQENTLDLAERVASGASRRLMAVMQGDRSRSFGEDVKPWLKNPPKELNLQFRDELPAKTRYEIYRNAAATIYVNQWEDPFGMELLESLASGTPVIALRRGSAPEVIEHGRTGYLVETEKEMIEAARNIDKIKRKDCRESVQERFSSRVIAGRYEEIYEKLLSRRLPPQ